MKRQIIFWFCFLFSSTSYFAQVNCDSIAIVQVQRAPLTPQVILVEVEAGEQIVNLPKWQMRYEGQIIAEETNTLFVMTGSSAHALEIAEDFDPVANFTYEIELLLFSGFDTKNPICTYVLSTKLLEDSSCGDIAISLTQFVGPYDIINVELTNSQDEIVYQNVAQIEAGQNQLVLYEDCLPADCYHLEIEPEDGIWSASATASIFESNFLGTIILVQPINPMFPIEYDFEVFDGCSLATVQNLEQATFSISPNPNSGAFKIRFDQSFSGKINVANQQGRIVYSTQVQNSIETNLAPALSSGIYIVNVPALGITKQFLVY